jgi:hypothetical protein
MKCTPIFLAAIICCSCGNAPQQAPTAPDDGAYHFDIKNIVQIKVDNQAIDRCSYVLTKNNTKWHLVCTKHDSISPTEEQIQHYLSYFYRIEYEHDSACEHGSQDSISVEQEYTITIKYVDEGQHKLTLFKKYISDSINIFGQKVNYDQNKCFVRQDSSDMHVGWWINYDILTPDCRYFSSK